MGFRLGLFFFSSPKNGGFVGASARRGACGEVGDVIYMFMCCGVCGVFSVRTPHLATLSLSMCVASL